MKYQISTFNKYTDSQDFLKFCKESSLEVEQLAAQNMWADDWQNQKHTLPYIVFIVNRFSEPNGGLFLLKDNEKIIGCSGIYKSEFSDDVCIAGVRTWVTKEYRNHSLVRDYFLTAHKEWAINKGFKLIALTFNEYNRNIIKIWKRTRLGEVRNPRQPHHMFYKNFNEVPFSITVQYTKQWAIYEQLDETFNFDWQSIRST
jgi:hypothetical protein